MNFNGETFHFKLFYKNNTAKIPTTKQYKEKTKSKIKVIFNVFKEEDERLYKQLLG